jgi:putative transposase
MSPVRAGLVVKPEELPQSSASAHISGYDDALVKAAPWLKITGGTWKDFLTAAMRKEEIMEMQRHERIGRPLISQHVMLDGD